MAQAAASLSDSLFQEMQKEKFIVLNTIDSETGGPTSSAISWVYAKDANTLRFALDVRSRIVQNIKNNPNVVVSFFAFGGFHAIYGKADIVVDALEGVPFKLACVDVAIEAVRDALFYGSKVTVEPEYEKTYDKRAAEKLDGQVFTAMKKA